MNNNQKQSIIEMRWAGLGYKKIAQTLGLPIGTVQSFCRRECVRALETPIHDENHCQLCGKQLVQRKGIKKRKFCSDDCRIKWWTEHPCAKNGNTKSSHESVCVNCGTMFRAYGSAPRKYCSHECYIAARFGGKGR